MSGKNPLLPIFLIVAVDVLGLTLMIPLLPFYAERLGATPTVAGLLVGVYAACQLVSGPLLGRLSDHMGRKPLLIVSQIGTCVGFLITASAHLLWLVFLGRIIDGSTAGNLSLAQAYISDVTKPEERAKSFGVIGIAFGLGFLIGPAISGFLSKFDYRYPMYAAALMSFTSILATTFLLPSVAVSQKAREASGGGSASAGPGGRRVSIVQWGEYFKYFRQPALATLLAQFLFFAFSFSMFVAGLPLFAERRFTWHGRPFGPEQTGYAWAWAGFLGILLQGPGLGKMVKRFGERALNRTGFAAYVLGYLMMAFAHSIPMLIATITVLAFGGLVRPTLTSMITHVAPREEQGSVLGLNQSLNSVSQIAAPPLGGLLITHQMLAAWAIVAACVAAGGLVLATRKLGAPLPASVEIDT
ncbi:MAG TPA: MFS transporter [Bryobacteraceae bacterium]|nr:MFS transporter [Bryobacteraceae bacterium]